MSLISLSQELCNNMQEPERISASMAGVGEGAGLCRPQFQCVYMWTLSRCIIVVDILESWNIDWSNTKYIVYEAVNIGSPTIQLYFLYGIWMSVSDLNQDGWSLNPTSCYRKVFGVNYLKWMLCYVFSHSQSDSENVKVSETAWSFASGTSHPSITPTTATGSPSTATW